MKELNNIYKEFVQELVRLVRAEKEGEDTPLEFANKMDKAMLGIFQKVERFRNDALEEMGWTVENAAKDSLIEISLLFDTEDGETSMIISGAIGSRKVHIGVRDLCDELVDHNIDSIIEFVRKQVGESGKMVAATDLYKNDASLIVGLHKEFGPEGSELLRALVNVDTGEIKVEEESVS